MKNTNDWQKQFAHFENYTCKYMYHILKRKEAELKESKLVIGWYAVVDDTMAVNYSFTKVLKLHKQLFYTIFT